MTLIIKWSYPTEIGEFEKFEQKINIKTTVSFPSFCGGSQILNVVNACFADTEFPKTNYDYSDFNKIFFDIFKRSFSEIYSFTNFGILCAHIDIIAYIAESIFEKIRNICKTALKSEKIDQSDIQERIDSYLRDYNSLFENFIFFLRRKFNPDFYDEIKDVMRRFVQLDPSKKGLKKYYESSGGRCFATFIEKSNREKYISFSGFLDCEDPDILKWLGSRRQKFVDVARDICKACNATFVQTNKEIKIYQGNCRKNNIFVVNSLGQAITNGAPNAFRGDYSCSERKIFGYFLDITPDGWLYVKYHMCCKCCKGYFYQIRGARATIQVYDGLK